MNQLLAQTLSSFRPLASTAVQRSAAALLERNPNSFFKYERGILRKIADQEYRGQLVRSRLINEVSEYLRHTLNEAFTIENLKAHEMLLAKKLIGFGNSAFLEPQIRFQLSAIMSRNFQMSPLLSGYRGDAPNVTAIAAEAVIEAYRDVVRDLLRQAVAASVPAPDVPEQIRLAASEGVRFKVNNGRFGITAQGLPDASDELVGLLKELLGELSYVESSLANSHPRLYDAIRKYRKEINKSSPSPLRIFMFGGDIQSYIARRQKSGQLLEFVDRDVVELVDQFLIRHSMLIGASAEVLAVAEQYEKIARLEIGNLGLFLPTVKAVEDSPNVFDEPSRLLAQEVQAELASGGAAVQATAAAVSRGSLAAVGSFALDAAKEGVKDAIKREVSDGLRSEKLYGEAQAFIERQQDQLGELANELPGTFGWVAGLLRLFKPD
ncbi:hypothetical protein [Falsiroseomonas frigidaquae]|nr:hypothetical protein [Falsiroseomonas frigidaquae]